ncbi:YafY family transcriptional regulator [Terrimonas sp. NA20]|uniref:YafY family transcriptional regulator n=1 Tax=Terrimonas ginsenosidimutans TaxID=2908004 RepID=A0ABS9KN22_9BACT|nr:YafY family protein [Terrimonas ginsenosidimutans]MCG2613706.1 YafY family transcriptional regulator [Terrimonas ginsenosidimutans]
MNRIDRVTAILIQLQSRKVVKAQDIAERFNISLRTVYRDVKTLEEAGIPVLGEAGVGYSIMDGYRLPPVMFTREEATAFLTAEKLIEKLADSSTDESYKSAMYKIRAVLRGTEKDFLENLDEHIQVYRSRRNRHATFEVNPIQTILKSIAGKNVISIKYFAQHSQEKTDRMVEPVGVFYLDGYWHLIAYCRLRKDYRDFRLDRMKDIRETDQLFDKAHPTLKAYMKEWMREMDLTQVIIRVDKKTLPYLEDQKYYSGFVSQKEVGDKIEMTFLTASLSGFAHWYLTFGNYAEIIQPVKLKEKVKESAKAILESLK